MPLEMLKAQAIVARTYAAYHRRLNAGKPYEIVAATVHQQYAGRVARTRRSGRRCGRRAGQVLLWEGDLFPAFYHTDSGGHTEDPRMVFAAANMPALRAGARARFPPTRRINSGPSTCRLAELSAAMQRAGVGVGRVSGLDVLERSVSLRVTRIAVQGSAGRVVLRGNDFRRVLGYDTLKSTLFAVAVDNIGARFAGRGYGHGVGLDQAGAKTHGASSATPRDRSWSTTTRASRSPRCSSAPRVDEPVVGRVREGRHARRRRGGRAAVSRGAAPRLQALDGLRRPRRQALQRPDHPTLRPGRPRGTPGRSRW